MKVLKQKIIILFDNTSSPSVKATIEFPVRNFQLVFSFPNIIYNMRQSRTYFLYWKVRMLKYKRKVVSLKTNSRMKLVEELTKKIGTKEILGMWTNNFLILSKDNETFTNGIGNHKKAWHHNLILYISIAAIACI